MFIHLSAHDQKILHKCKKRIKWHYAVCYRQTIANMKLGKDVFCIPDKTCEEDTVFSTVERTSVCKFSMNEAEATGEAKYYAIALLFELPLRDGELCALIWGNIIKDIKGNSKLVIERQLVTDCTSGKAKGYRIVNYGKTRAAYREITLSERAIQILARVKDLNTQRLSDYTVRLYLYEKL